MKRTSLAIAQIQTEDTQYIGDLQRGARACIEFLNHLRAKGISWHASELHELFYSLNPDAASAFLFNLEIFLAEAVCHNNVQDCYEDGKLAHQRVRKAHVARLVASQAANKLEF